MLEEPALRGDAEDGPHYLGLKEPVNESDPCFSSLATSQETWIIPCCEGFIPMSTAMINVALAGFQSMPEAAASLL